MQHKIVYIELKNKLKDYIIFSQKQIRKIYPKFNIHNFKEWQKKKYIRKVIKGCYIFSDLDISEPILFIISNEIYKPSYISFEMALSHYQIIPETVYGITAATTRHTYKFKTRLANFSYRKIRPVMMFGYKLKKYKNHVFKIAEVEKAIIDYFYANAKLKESADFEELRMDKTLFDEQVDPGKINKYLKIIDSDVLSRRVRRFLRYMKHA